MIELPTPTSFRQHERCSQVIKKFTAGDSFGAEGHHMRRGLLAVHESESPGLQLAHERDQRDFRGVRDMGEHRLCEKDTAQCHAVEAAYQLSILPRLNGMGVPEFM